MRPQQGNSCHYGARWAEPSDLLGHAATRIEVAPSKREAGVVVDQASDQFEVVCEDEKRARPSGFQVRSCPT